MPDLLRTLLRNGDIILFHTKGLSVVSFGIRLLTHSYWNHAGVYVENVYKEGFVIEALGKGVVQTPIEKYLNNKNYDLKVVKFNQLAFRNTEEYIAGIKTFVERMFNSVGRKYDWWAVVYLGVKYIAKGFWNRGAKYLPARLNPFQNRERFFCSELICENTYKISSIIENFFVGEKYLEATCSTITPKDIAKSKCITLVWGDKNVI